MSNVYAQELLKQVDQRFNRDTDTTPLSEWLMMHTKLKGKPFSFNRYPFQRALVDETARSAVTIKPSQVGVSEVYQRVALGILARNRFRKGIYAYPDDEMRKKNNQTRVMPMVEETKAFSPPLGQSWVRSIQLIELNKSFLYMTGSKTADATSTDADYIMLDEYDLHDMANAALFSSRLQNSDWKIERYFSTPTYMDFGVDGLYNESDQHEYLLKCDSCNHWQFPLFEPQFVHMPGLPGDWESLLELTSESLDTYGIDLTSSYVCCEKCRIKLDLGREDNRAWVPKYPSRQTMRGRKINPFSVSTRPVLDIVADLLKYKKNDFIRGFKNSVLGIAEDSSNNRIDEASIRAATKSPSIPLIDSDAPTWLGCDMGHTCHLVLGQGRDHNLRTVLMEQVPLGKIKERITDVLKVYNIVGGTVDRHPESQVAADIWELSNGVIVPAEYRGTAEMNLVMVPGDKEKVLYIQVDRTLHLDQVQRVLRRAELEFYGYGLLSSEIMTQLRNMIRVEEPESPAVWKKISQNDHFFHALGFMLTARKLRPYIDLKVGPTLSLLGFAVADAPGYSMGLTQRDTKWQERSTLF